MTYAVTAVVNSRHFTHTGYAALVVKDAIADFFRRLTRERPSVDQKSPDLLVNVHISNEKVTISLDSSGHPACTKEDTAGARSEAPLSEVLAAGMICPVGMEGRDAAQQTACAARGQ
ncbi:MAG: THUMP domain-containing protein [Marinilabiliales bacterium]|nr:THUMP domain-containing protein [Marinilabiliales bacterium]